MVTKYLDPKNDLAFKKIFGAEKHKRIPISFLNAVFHLTGEDEIIDLEFLNNVQPPEIEAQKESIVDLLVRDQRGTRYIVEMQVAKVKGFEKRAQLYAAKAYCAHFNQGDKYEDLTRVIFLAITDYIVFPNKKDYKSDHVTLDKKTYENDLQDFSFTFVELPKFTKENHDLKTIEEKWYYFLKHADDSDNINEILANHAEIREAYNVLDRVTWTEAELNSYDRLVMETANKYGMIDAATEEGLKKGFEKGDKHATVRIAMMLLGKGHAVQEIIECTGLSEEEVQSLLKKSVESV